MSVQAMTFIRPPVMPMATNMRHVMEFKGVGRMPAKGEDEQEAARLFFLAATWATHRLVIGVGG